MKTLDTQFASNANQLGLMDFCQVKLGTNPKGHNVYIYERKSSNGVLGYEVFVSSIKKAGTYPLPNNKTITYNEDFEEYPGASKFGQSAYFCTTLERAMVRFNEFMSLGDESLVSAPKPAISCEPKQRKKGERLNLIVPNVEFSVKELAELNKVNYPIAFFYVKEQTTSGLIKFVKSEQRTTRGKPTNLFIKV